MANNNEPPLSIVDIAAVFDKQFILFTGSISKDGCPLIHFPSSTYDIDNAAVYKKVMTYLAKIPTLSSPDAKFLIVIDRRKGKWSGVKTLLLKISTLFSGDVQEVILLRPSGFFQRNFMDFSEQWLKETFKFEVIVTDTVSTVHDRVDKNKLVSSLGGTLQFNQKEWIENRMALERVSMNAFRLEQRLTYMSHEFDDVELPNDVSSTELIITDQTYGKNEMLDDISSARVHAESMLECIGQELPMAFEGAPPLAMSPDKLVNIMSLEKILSQVETTSKLFDTFWEKHIARLEQCLLVRKFEEGFKKLQGRLGRVIGKLESTSNNMATDTVADVSAQLSSLSLLKMEGEEAVGLASDLREEGEGYIKEAFYGHGSSVGPKCEELERMESLYRSLIEGREKRLQKAKGMHGKITKASTWCQDGLELLSSVSSGDGETADEVAIAISRIDIFLGSRLSVNLRNWAEFKVSHEGLLSESSQSLVEELVSKMEDVCSMCQRKRDNLEHQLLTDESLMPESPGADPLSSSAGSFGVRSRHHSDDSRSRVSADSTEEERRSVATLHSIEEQDGKGKWKHRKKSIKKNFKGMFKRGNTEREILSPLSGGQGHPLGGDMPLSLPRRSSDGSIGSGSEKGSTSCSSRRNAVMGELYETEKTYVEELGAILQGYHDAFESFASRKDFPASLVKSKARLFGNLKEIHEFHSQTFLKELELCRNTPSLVGQCFVNRSTEFQMYSVYCQNKPQSDRVLDKLGSSHPYLRDCQSALGQQLPLGAYLLKPVQRITKYQLLLKEMMRYMGGEEAGSSELRQALHCMLGVLKHVNDLMHQVAITGYTGKLSELGKLMMQGQLVVSSKKAATRGRHVFLYERALLFCKEKGEAGKKAIYVYKFHIPVEQLNTGSDDGKNDPRRFEVTTILRKPTTNGAEPLSSSTPSGAFSAKRGGTLPRMSTLNGAGGLAAFGGGTFSSSLTTAETYVLQAPSEANKKEWLVQLRSAMLLELDTPGSQRLANVTSTASLFDLPSPGSITEERSIVSGSCSSSTTTEEHGILNSSSGSGSNIVRDGSSTGGDAGSAASATEERNAHFDFSISGTSRPESAVFVSEESSPADSTPSGNVNVASSNPFDSIGPVNVSSCGSGNDSANDGGKTDNNNHDMTIESKDTMVAASSSSSSSEISASEPPSPLPLISESASELTRSDLKVSSNGSKNLSAALSSLITDAARTAETVAKRSVSTGEDRDFRLPQHGSGADVLKPDVCDENRVDGGTVCGEEADGGSGRVKGSDQEADEGWSSGGAITDSEGEVPSLISSQVEPSVLSPADPDASLNRLYVVGDDIDSQAANNDLLLSPGDVVEEMRSADDWMMVRIPGTHITGWMPAAGLKLQDGGGIQV